MSAARRPLAHDPCSIIQISETDNGKHLGLAAGQPVAGAADRLADRSNAAFAVAAGGRSVARVGIDHPGFRLAAVPSNEHADIRLAAGAARAGKRTGYSGATDPDAFLGPVPDARLLDPAFTSRDLEEAKRANAFAQWWFGPPSPRPAALARDPRAGPSGTLSEIPWTRPSPIDLSAGVRGSAPSDLAWPTAAATAVTDKAALRAANLGDEWNVSASSPDIGPVGAFAGGAQPPGPDDATGNQDIKQQRDRLSAQARYRRAQAGDESFAPQFVRTGPTLPELVLDGLEDDARMATTPPPQLPPNVFIHGDGFYVGRYPDGRLVRWEDADPDAANAYYEEMQKRAELPARTALSLLSGGAGFAERGALGVIGGRLLTGQTHHGITKRIFEALENHKNLRGYYKHRDPRFETKAVDLAAHNGYWGWHEDLDAEIVDYINGHRNLTPTTFENYLHRRYAKPDLKARFPDGFPRR